MARLIDDLLDVSRITRGHIELRRERVELSRVLELAVEASRPHITEHSHQLSIARPTSAVALDGDVTRLSQVVSSTCSPTPPSTRSPAVTSTWRASARGVR
jgi:signal transduction histidine kinase